MTTDSIMRVNVKTTTTTTTTTLNEDTHLVIGAIGVTHAACKDEFRRNPRSHSWSVFRSNPGTMCSVGCRKFGVCGAGMDLDIFGRHVY